MPPPVSRSAVTPGQPYQNYRDELRFDFWFACAYCSMTEMEATAVSFEIDHHQPTSKGGTDAYDNLMWACAFCNGRKSNYWPSAAVFAAGYRYMRPDVDDPHDHLPLDEHTGVRVRPATPVGEYTDEMLDLNRAAMLEIRKLRQQLLASKQGIAHGLARLSRSMRGLDHIKPELRAKYQKAVRDARAGAEELQMLTDVGDFELYLIASNKSPNIQAGAARRAHTARKRQFLKDLAARFPDPEAPQVV